MRNMFNISHKINKYICYLNIFLYLCIGVKNNPREMQKPRRASHDVTPGRSKFYLAMANLKKSIDTRKRVSEILAAGVISEKDLNLFKSRQNRGLCEYEDIEPLFLDYIALSDDQTAKGVNWLRDLYKSPSGKIRKNNPFGAREIDVLEGENIKINLCGFYDAGRYGCHNYTPNYCVYSEKGSFEYVPYCEGHKCYITA